MQKTKIEWTDYSWNPILGICPVECKLPNGKIYCYAQKRYKRFNLCPTIRPAEGYSSIIDMPLLDRKRKIISRKVFVCSEFELFHPSVKKKWRDWIFDNIKYHSHLTFQILTKFPQNIDRPMPDNVHLGTTITGPEDFESRSYHLGKRETKAKLKFWSIEPLLADIIEPMLDKDGSWKYIAKEEKIRWIIIGRLTGYGHKYNPKWDWINRIISYARHYDIPVFLKDNLIPIMGKKYVMWFREFPKEI